MSDGTTTPDRTPAHTIGHLLVVTQQFFAQKGIDTARLDAELLLADALGVDRIYLYTHYDQPLDAAEVTAFREGVRRRGRREPVAYILGRREFFGRDFQVSPAVLIPRPETEHLVESVLEWVEQAGRAAVRILDIGTGSGALALTLAAELPQADVWATDISAAALQVAAANATALGVAERVTFREGDLFAPLATLPAFDVIVANPPYVPLAERATLDADVRDFEPATALFAADAGLAVIKRLCAAAAAHLTPGGLLAFEMGMEQEAGARTALAAGGPWLRVRLVRDLQGHPRIMLAERGQE